MIPGCLNWLWFRCPAGVEIKPLRCSSSGYGHRPEPCDPTRPYTCVQCPSTFQPQSRVVYVLLIPLPCRCSRFDSPDQSGPAYSQSVAVALGGDSVAIGAASSRETMRRLSEGISVPTIRTNPRPMEAFSPTAKLGLVAPATTPVISIPRGILPIARLVTPRARPRISFRATSITMVACMVPKPADPSPSINISGNETAYREEKENSSSPAIASMVPPM